MEKRQKHKSVDQKRRDKTKELLQQLHQIVGSDNDEDANNPMNDVLEKVLLVLTNAKTESSGVKVGEEVLPKLISSFKCGGCRRCDQCKETIVAQITQITVRCYPPPFPPHLYCLDQETPSLLQCLTRSEKKCSTEMLLGIPL